VTTTTYLGPLGFGRRIALAEIPLVVIRGENLVQLLLEVTGSLGLFRIFRN
jgi:hypothetical protein